MSFQPVMSQEARNHITGTESAPRHNAKKEKLLQELAQTFCLLGKPEDSESVVLKNSSIDYGSGSLVFMDVFNFSIVFLAGQNSHLKTQLPERVWRKGNPLTLLVGMQTSTAAMENSVEIP